MRKYLIGGQGDHFTVKFLFFILVKQHGKLVRTTGSGGGDFIHILVVFDKFLERECHNNNSIQKTANDVKLFTGIFMDEKNAAQAEMLSNRLKKRYRHLRKWAKRSGTDAFRLYDRDIPEIPLVLDIYGDIVCGALYKRPYEKDEGEEIQWLAAMTDAAALSMGINRENIVIKQRQRQKGTAQYEKIASQALTRIVGEGGLQFKVNLSNYLDTGLFLDRRIMRSMVRDGSQNRRVLNLFCYTASFSVYAASGGAASTDSVDLSNTYLGWARENFTLNGYAAEIIRPQDFFAGAEKQGANKDTTGPCRNNLIRADVSSFLRSAAEARQRWDMIVLDPPIFSNSTMARADFDLQRDLWKLLGDCLTLLSPGGKLWLSVSSRSFKTCAADIEILLAEHFAGIKVSDISDKLVDEDFRGKKPPKTYIIK